MTTLITSAAFKPIVAFAFKPTAPFFWFYSDAFYGRIFWEQSHLIHENPESISSSLLILFEEMKDTMYIT